MSTTESNLESSTSNEPSSPDPQVLQDGSNRRAPRKVNEHSFGPSGSDLNQGHAKNMAGNICLLFLVHFLKRSLSFQDVESFPVRSLILPKRK